MARTTNLIAWDKGYQYAMAAEVVAIQGLVDDLESDQEDGNFVDDCEEERWAVDLPPSPYEDAMLSATVQDLQGRFNLNWLVQAQGDEFVRDPAARQALERLLAASLADPTQARLLSYEMVDWIDSNNLVDDVEGAEDPEYRGRRTPNMPVAHESELRALRSMTLDQIPADGEFWGLFTALPVDVPLNLNTASTPVLDAVLGHYGGGAAQAVEQLRAEEPIADPAQLFSVAPFSELDGDQRQELARRVDVKSAYFQVMIDVQLEKRRSRLVSRLYRNPQAGPGQAPVPGQQQQQGQQQGQGTGEGRTATVISRQLVPVLGPLEPPCNPLYNASDTGTGE